MLAPFPFPIWECYKYIYTHHKVYILTIKEYSCSKGKWDTRRNGKSSRRYDFCTWSLNPACPMIRKSKNCLQLEIFFPLLKSWNSFIKPLRNHGLLGKIILHRISRYICNTFKWNLKWHCHEVEIKMNSVPLSWGSACTYFHSKNDKKSGINRTLKRH